MFLHFIINIVMESKENKSPVKIIPEKSALIA